MKRCLLGLTLMCVSAVPANSAPADDNKRAEAEAILDRAIKEYGGLDRLAKLQVSVEARTVKGASPIFCKISWQRPNRLRIDENALHFKGPAAGVIDGEETWSIVRGTLIEDTEWFEAWYTSDRCLAFGADLLVLKQEGYTLTPLGKTKIDDQVAVGIMAIRKGYAEQTLYFDKDTGLLIKRCLKFSPRIAGFPPLQYEIRFEDYKEVGKIKYASKARVVQGFSDWEFVVDKFKPVENIDVELFKKPE
jgi:hypothetical protein